MKARSANQKISFQNAVESTPDIATAYRLGLSALGSYKNRVEASDITKVEGSVDIDSSTQMKYPNENRWDYAFAYKSQVFFVEVHSASSGEVRVVIKKLQWLKDWLQNQAPEVNRLKAKKNAFVWVQSKGFDIPRHTPQYRLAVTHGILPVKTLVLS